MFIKDYYAILGIDNSATKDEIENAYSKKLEEYNLDKSKSEEEKKRLKEKIEEIQESYKVLSDEKERKKYDKYYKEIQKEREKTNSQTNDNNQNKNNESSSLLFFTIGNAVFSILVSIIISYLMVQNYMTKYYSFDVSAVMQEEENMLLKLPSDSMKHKIDNFALHLGNFLETYNRKGIVLVTGATVGRNPKIKDITNEFMLNEFGKKYNPIKKTDKNNKSK